MSAVVYPLAVIGALCVLTALAAYVRDVREILDRQREARERRQAKPVVDDAVSMLKRWDAEAVEAEIEQMTRKYRDD